MRECIHAVNPAPAAPPPPPPGERLIIRRLFPFPRFQSSTLVEELSSLSPLSLSFLSLSLLSTVISPAWLQGRIKAEWRRREMGERKSGMEGESLCVFGVKERTGLLWHTYKPPIEIWPTMESHDWQLRMLTGDEPITEADVTNRKDGKCENGDIFNKSHSHHGCSGSCHSQVWRVGAHLNTVNLFFFFKVAKFSREKKTVNVRHFRLPCWLQIFVFFVGSQAQF